MFELKVWYGLYEELFGKCLFKEEEMDMLSVLVRVIDIVMVVMGVLIVVVLYDGSIGFSDL